MRKQARRRKWTTSSFTFSMLFIVAALLAGTGLFAKDFITTTFRPGETIQVNFAEDYRLRAYVAGVKVAGIRVGTVSDVDRAPDGSAVVSVKVDYGIREKLGSTPRAAIRPTTLLGGATTSTWRPAGITEPNSPARSRQRAHRCRSELDKVADALQPDAVRGVRSATARLDETLAGGGRTARARHSWRRAAGSSSVTTTFVAGDGPPLLTVSV